MLTFLKNAVLEVKHSLKLRALQKEKDREISKLRKKEKHEKELYELRNQQELEIIKANIRKEQSKSSVKPGAQPKTGWDKFQDFASDFATRQSTMGDMGINPGGKHGRTHKKKGKGNREGIGSGFYFD